MREVGQIVSRFREAGLKITPQRISIFHLLQDNRNHPSAEEVYREALRIHPSISFTTVYKTLQTLRDMGEIQELVVDPERVHFDPVTREHIHLFCERCKSVNDLEMDHRECDRIFRSARGPEGFEVHSRQIHIIGLCEDCC
jgi:Fur family peroxide stress response transcriptional regulator